MELPNAVVFYYGPSQLTGEPVVGIISQLANPSGNTKTGPMAQAYILRPDMPPTDAIATGADRAICGDCALRGDGTEGRGCYVTWWQGPLMVYKNYKAGLIPKADVWTARDYLRHRKVRLAAYGDPAAIHLNVWAALLSKAAGWTGYTQQWRTCDPGFKFYLMASCLKPADYHEATAAGWHTYRIRKPGGAVFPGETVCPASKESAHKLTCHDCGICQGSGTSRPNAVIVAHGKPGNLTALGVDPNEVQDWGPKRKVRPGELTAASVAQAREDLKQPGMTVRQPWNEGLIPLASLKTSAGAENLTAPVSVKETAPEFEQAERRPTFTGRRKRRTKDELATAVREQLQQPAPAEPAELRAKNLKGASYQAAHRISATTQMFLARIRHGVNR